ncbi:microtubule-associated proteins 1A/1B light chain 3A [Eurytemora carolleeae]|uniref:microtubule-associated proteins 1A/1B light chain 3A n=1 Tax=Eurytemora carolleeae TaxID=1294199 RepID=UPI000C794811|nr:microtubule-associated proteins 1A/1B light chain 3A [Eurytemora carolleeae]|eukprot:XP_023328217.1 microtubule-associated proteins 1A/1B light chain 3A-like [Eurytemora affinis]
MNIVDMNIVDMNIVDMNMSDEKSLLYSEDTPSSPPVKYFPPCRTKFPRKIPVIVERYRKEKVLPEIDKVKFLVPEELTLSQLANILRMRLKLTPTQAFFLFIDNGHIPVLSAVLVQLHRKYKDEDGFLYITYASQESFG